MEQNCSKLTFGIRGLCCVFILFSISNTTSASSGSDGGSGSGSRPTSADTNRHSPVLDMREYIVNVPEDTNPGNIILTVTATDGDDPASPAGQIANFAITGSDSVYFRIVQNVTNNFIGHVILNTTLDHEIDWMYDFTVTATDNGPIPRHSMPASHVIINVTDANEGGESGGDGTGSSAPIIGGSLGGVAFLFIIIFISCTIILYIRHVRKKRLQAFDERMATNFNVNMIANPCYIKTKQDDHQYDYVLPQYVQNSVLEMYRGGQRCNTSNGATGAKNITITQSCNSDIKQFSSEDEDIDEDGYLQVYSYNSQRAGYKATGNSHDTDNVTVIPNPSYEVASRGVKLQNNPSYNKITYI